MASQCFCVFVRWFNSYSIKLYQGIHSPKQRLNLPRSHLPTIHPSFGTKEANREVHRQYRHSALEGRWWHLDFVGWGWCCWFPTIPFIFAINVQMERRTNLKNPFPKNHVGRKSFPFFGKHGRYGLIFPGGYEHSAFPDPWVTSADSYR